MIVRPASAVALALLLLGGCLPKFGSDEPEPEPAQTETQVDDQLAVLAEDEIVYDPVEAAPAPPTKPGAERAEAVQSGEAAPSGEAPSTTQVDPVTLLPVPGSAAQQQPLPDQDRRQVPHIYLSLQPQGEGRPISAIFAIDAARDASPSDDPAIRLTPENGLCNPQSMQFYTFPEADAERPVVTDADGAQGLSAANLPSVLAVIVTERMIAAGLAETAEDTRALNVCTRKLWEQLVLTENERGVASGQ